MNTKIQTKNAFFFSHDSNARNDEKIINLRMKMGAEGYGIYFMLIEMLLESSSYELSTNYLVLAFNLHVEVEQMRSVVEDFGLFEFSEEKKSFYSPSFSKRMEPLENLREQRRLAGVKSGEARRKKAEQKALLEAQKQENERPLPKNEHRRVEESRAEQSKAEESKVEVASPTERKATGFVSPLIDEVEEYCKERKNSVDATRFLNFYQAKGWMVGRNKMTDWRAAIRTWEGEERIRRRQKVPNIANHNNEVEYEQF